MNKYKVGAAALAALGLVGCEDYQGNENGPKTAIIGDSITNRSIEALHAELDPTYYVSVSGEEGAAVHEQQDDADGYATTNPSIAVINLGANDAWRNYPSWLPIWNLAVMANTFPSSCVVFTTITVDTPWPTFNAVAQDINNWLRDESGRPIADWDAASDASHTEDYIHPTEAGKQLLASLTHQAMEAC